MNQKLHWYLVSYIYTNGTAQGYGFGTVSVGFDVKNVSRSGLKETANGIESEISTNSVAILGMSYLGHMTEEEFKN